MDMDISRYDMMGLRRTLRLREAFLHYRHLRAGDEPTFEMIDKLSGRARRGWAIHCQAIRIESMLMVMTGRTVDKHCRGVQR